MNIPSKPSLLIVADYLDEKINDLGSCPVHDGEDASECHCSWEATLICVRDFLRECSKESKQ